MKRWIRMNRNRIVSAITVVAIMICILSAKCVGQGTGDEERILFIVSAIWIVLVTIVNWKRLWKG